MLLFFFIINLYDLTIFLLFQKEINDTLIKLKETNLFNGFDIESSELIKEIIKVKLMQLRAGFGDQLDKDMDENTYTSTIISTVLNY